MKKILWFIPIIGYVLMVLDYYDFINLNIIPEKFELELLGASIQALGIGILFLVLILNII